MVVEELGEGPRHYHGGDGVDGLQRIGEKSSHHRLQCRGGRPGSGQGVKGREHLGHGGLNRRVAGLLPQHGVLVPAQVEQMSQGHQRVGLVFDCGTQRRQFLGR